jgi:hypothetical protein
MLALARLLDVAIVSFAVDPAAMQALLPPGLDADPTLTPDGRALVSTVSFVADDLRLSGLRALRLRCGHVDYRGYVRAGEERGVWFFGAAMDSRLAGVVRSVWHMPWHRAAVTLTAGHDGHYDLAVRDGVADAQVRANGHAGQGPAAAVDGSGRIVNPCVGWFRGRRGRVHRYEVSHEPLTPHPIVAGRADVGLFRDLGLTKAGAEPHSMLRVPDFDIRIALPPRPAGTNFGRGTARR